MKIMRSSPILNLLQYFSVGLIILLSACTSSNIDTRARIDLTTGTTNKLVMWVPVGNIPNQVPSLSSYIVPLRKIELGNEENNTLTLWENEAIKAKSIYGGLRFDNLNKLTNGSYAFLRAIFDNELVCTISFTNYIGSNVSTTFTNNLMGSYQVFGISGSKGDVRQTLPSKIKIYEGAALTFIFAISNTFLISNGYVWNAIPGISLSNF